MAPRHRNDGFQSFSLMGFLTKPFRAVGNWLADTIDRSDRLQSDRTFVGSIVSVLLLPLRLLVAWALFMINSWAVSRHGWAFLWGLPAVLAIAGSLSGLWVASFLRQGQSVNASQAYYNLFRTDPDKGPKIAEIFAVKLVELEPQSDAMKYQLGLIRAENGNNISAKDIMCYLAPEERLGFAGAHVWLARYYLSPLSEMAEGKRDELVVKHFDSAIAVDPANPFALFSLAEFHELKALDFKAGTPERNAELLLAMDYLKQLLGSEIENEIQLTAVPKLIKLLIDMDKKPEAIARLNLILKKFMPLVRRNPDVVDFWRIAVASCVLVGDYDEANAILEEAVGLSRKPEVKMALEQMSTALVVEKANTFTDLKDRRQYLDRLNLLCVAVVKHSQNRVIYQKLLEYVNAKANPDLDIAWLEESLIESTQPGVVHILLGLDKITRGDVLTGQKHWRIAEQHLPVTPTVINNLMEVAISDNPDDFDNLLDLVTLAVELFPNAPMFYQTRGLYYKKMKRLPEAIADFKHAIESLPKNLLVRKLLIECHDEFGETELANEQRRGVNKILEELNEDDRRLAEQFMNQIN